VMTAATTTGFRLLNYNGSIGVTFANYYYYNAGKPAFLSSNNGISRVTVLDSATVYLFDLSGNYVGTDVRSGEEIYPDGPVTDYPVGILQQQPVRARNVSSPIGSILMLPVGAIDDSMDGVICDLTSVLPAGYYLGGISLCVDRVHAIIFAATTTPGVNNRWYLVSFDGNSVSLEDDGTIWTDVDNIEFGLGNSSTLYYRVSILESDLKHIWTAYGAADLNVRYYEIDDNNVLQSMGYQSYAFPDSLASSPSIWADDGIAYAVSEDEFVTLTRLNSYTPGTVTLSSIVQDLCTDCGLVAGDLDVSALTDNVDGAALATQMTGRAAIEPFQQAYYFDVVESDYKLKFVKRS